jgi:hypothetical protein
VLQPPFIYRVVEAQVSWVANFKSHIVGNITREEISMCDKAGSVGAHSPTQGVKAPMNKKTEAAQAVDTPILTGGKSSPVLASEGVPMNNVSLEALKAMFAPLLQGTQ